MVGVGLPEAVQLKVTLLPSSTFMFEVCAVIEGATRLSTTVEHIFPRNGKHNKVIIVIIIIGSFTSVPLTCTAVLSCIVYQ